MLNSPRTTKVKSKLLNTNYNNSKTQVWQVNLILLGLRLLKTTSVTIVVKRVSAVMIMLNNALSLTFC